MAWRATARVLAGIEGNYTGIGDLVPGVVRVPAHDPEALARVLRSTPAGSRPSSASQ